MDEADAEIVSLRADMALLRGIIEDEIARMRETPMAKDAPPGTVWGPLAILEDDLRAFDDGRLRTRRR